MSAFDFVLEAFINALDFKGRARRKEFWWFLCFNICVGTFISLSAKLLHSPMLGLVHTAYQLGMFFPTISIYIRRMHDLNLSGWYSMIPIYSLYLAAKVGTDGPNRFGKDPKRHDDHPSQFPMAA